MKYAELLRSVVVVNIALIFIFVALVVSHSPQAIADTTLTPAPDLGMGTQLSNSLAPEDASIPSWALGAAEAAVCPNIFSLHSQDAVDSSALPVSAAVQADAAAAIETPQDAQSFVGDFTLSELNAAGLNPGTLEGSSNLSTRYVLAVSHGSWPADEYETFPEPTNSQPTSASPVVWRYEILNSTTGMILAGGGLPATPAGC